MLVYWLLFAFFATGALLRRGTVGRQTASIPLLIGAILVWLAIGFRYKSVRTGRPINSFILMLVSPISVEYFDSAIRVTNC